MKVKLYYFGQKSIGLKEDGNIIFIITPYRLSFTEYVKDFIETKVDIIKYKVLSPFLILKK